MCWDTRSGPLWLAQSLVILKTKARETCFFDTDSVLTRARCWHELPHYLMSSVPSAKARNATCPAVVKVGAGSSAGGPTVCMEDLSCIPQFQKHVNKGLSLLISFWWAETIEWDNQWELFPRRQSESDPFCSWHGAFGFSFSNPNPDSHGLSLCWAPEVLHPF